MSFTGSFGQIRRGILTSPALVVAAPLLLGVACGSGMEPASPKSSDSAVLSTSSKHGDAGLQYTFEVFDVPGATRTFVASVNDEGAATGYYYVGESSQHGFIRSSSGAITTFDIPGAVFTIANGINDFGAVVGWFNTTDGNQHGFIRKPDGSIETLDFEPFAGVAGTYTSAINNRGDIVGGYGPTYDIGFVLRNGHYFPSPEPPGVSNPPWIFPYGINDLGVTTGFFEDQAGVDHGYVLRGTSYAIVDFPGSSFTTLFSVNDLGQVVAEPDNGCGFIFDIAKETFEPLPCVGIGSYADALNNRGQFAGFVYDSVDPDNLWHGLIATPVRSAE